MFVAGSLALKKYGQVFTIFYFERNQVQTRLAMARLRMGSLIARLVLDLAVVRRGVMLRSRNGRKYCSLHSSELAIQC